MAPPHSRCMARGAKQPAQYTIRCKVRVGVAEVSLKLVVGNSVTPVEFKELAWEEALRHIDSETAGNHCTDIRHYVLYVEEPATGDRVALPDSTDRVPLKHQLPKPARLHLEVARHYTEIQKLVADEQQAREGVTHSLANSLEALEDAVQVSRKSVAARLALRARITERNRVFERYAINLLAAEIMRQERVEKEANALRTLCADYDGLVRTLEVLMDKATLRKRHLQTLSSNLVKTRTRTHRSYLSGLRHQKEYHRVTLDPTTTYEPIPQTHRWLQELTHEDAALRVKYKQNLAAAHMTIDKDKARPVISQPLVSTVKSLQQLVAESAERTT